MTDISIEHYRKQFFRESSELIENIYDDILKAEAEPENNDILNSLFRGVHTIKGSAGSFGLDEISSFVHHLENLLNLLRESRLTLTPEMTDVILAAVDNISDMIQAKTSGQKTLPGSETSEELVKKLDCFCDFALPASDQICSQGDILPVYRTTKLEETALPQEIQEQLQGVSAKELNVFRISLCYTSEHLENGYDPYIFLKNLYDSCQYYHVIDYPGNSSLEVPPPGNFDPFNLYLKPGVCVGTKLSFEEIYELTIEPTLIFVEEILLNDFPQEVLNLSEFADPESINEFIIGTSEMLESAENAVMDYESTGSASAFNEIFRVVHNIKGDADFIGLKYMTEFAHTLESLLEKLRTGLVIKQDAGDILLGSIDFFWKNIKALDNAEEINGFPPVYETINNILALENKASDISPGKITRSEKTQKACAEEISKPQNPGILSNLDQEIRNVFFDQLIQYKTIIDPKFHPADRQTVLRALNGLSNAAKVVGLDSLKNLAEKAAQAFTTAKPGLMPLELDELVSYIDKMGIGGINTGNTGPGPKKIGEILISNGKITREDLAFGLSRQKPLGEILMESGKISEKDIEEALLTQEIIEKAGQKEESQSSGREVRTMRVDESKIEQLTNMAGELLIARNTYDYILGSLKKTKNIDQESYKALKENLYLFTHLTNDVHHRIMAMRMMPVGIVFRKYARIVRDISRKQKKSIDLIIKGEDIEIDKKAAEVLAEPMMHLVRNACDHGIEPVSERLSAGKPENGKLIMKASHEGSSLCISVKDDGKGIDRLKLREKLKMINMEVSDRDEDLLNMIFLPGVSTRAKATDLSGRGVGMDVVKTAVKSLGGNIRAASTQGKGTELKLLIPMSMGIEEVLLIELGNKTYAIPISFILETLKIPASKIKRFADRMFLHYRGEVINLEHLETLLYEQDFKKGKISSKLKNDDRETAVVVLKTIKGKLGIIVDRLDKNMELAIKPVPKQLAYLDIARGVSIMGNGRIIIVLNPDKLL